MKFLRSFLILAFLFSFPLCAEQNKPSLSLIYVGPGNAIYSTFGHVAFRLTDMERKTDVLFNFGSFDFTDPNFVPKFVKGQLDYYLGIASFKRDFKFYTKKENRTVIEQRLNLTQEEIAKVSDYLLNNALPENRYYRYDFIKDNCASRIKVVFDGTLGDTVEFNRNIINRIGERSYRSYIRSHLGSIPWFDFGIQLTLGMPIDSGVIPSDSFFLPELVQEIAENSHLSDGRKLILDTKVLYQSTAEPSQEPIIINLPFIIFSLLLVLELALIFLSKKRSLFNKMLSVFEYSAIVVNFLFGTLLFYLWFLSDHTATKLNLNLIWCTPLMIVFLITFFLRGAKKILNGFCIFQAVMCAVYLLIMAAGLQHSASPFVPLLLFYMTIFTRRLSVFPDNHKASASI